MCHRPSDACRRHTAGIVLICTDLTCNERIGVRDEVGKHRSLVPHFLLGPTNFIRLNGMEYHETNQPSPAFSFPLSADVEVYETVGISCAAWE